MTDEFLKILEERIGELDHAFLCQDCYNTLKEESGIRISGSVYPIPHHDESIKLDEKYIHRWEIDND